MAYVDPSTVDTGWGSMTGAIAKRNNEAVSEANPNLVDPYSGKATDKLGAITKQQWADYQSRFVPIENQLMDMTTYNNPDLANQEINRVETDTASAYDNIANASAIQMGRYGISRNADQQQSSDRLSALGKSGAIVDAANNIRLKLVERNQMIASGSNPGSMLKQG